MAAGALTSTAPSRSGTSSGDTSLKSRSRAMKHSVWSGMAATASEVARHVQAWRADRSDGDAASICQDACN